MKRIVYLLHFDKPYRHCLHYLGSTTNLQRRLKEHTSSHSRGLMKAIHKAGIGFKVVKVFHRKRVQGLNTPYRWIKGYDLEYYLKYKLRSNRRLCPICKDLPIPLMSYLHSDNNYYLLHFDKPCNHS